MASFPDGPGIGSATISTVASLLDTQVVLHRLLSHARRWIYYGNVVLIVGCDGVAEGTDAETVDRVRTTEVCAHRGLQEPRHNLVLRRHTCNFVCISNQYKVVISISNGI